MSNIAILTNLFYHSFSCISTTCLKEWYVCLMTVNLPRCYWDYTVSRRSYKLTMFLYNLLH